MKRFITTFRAQLFAALISVGTLSVESTAQSGGTVYLSTYVPGEVNARFTYSDGTGFGEGWTAQLYGGPAGTPFFELMPLVPVTSFRTASAAARGYVDPVVVTVPGVPPGSWATLVLRVFNGETFETSTAHGQTIPITISLGGGILPPANLQGLQGIVTSLSPRPPKPASRAQILFQDDGGLLAAWWMNGSKLESGSFLEPNHPGNGWRVRGTGDFNADGSEDLLFQHADASLAVWFMDGVRMNSASLLNPQNPGSGWRVVGVGDFNRDGKADVAFQHTDGTLAAWLMDRIKLSQASFFEPRHPGDARWKVAGSGDLDSDGKNDLVFQHGDGTVAIWFLDGVRMTRASLANPASAGEWQVAGVTDLDGDGKADLSFQNPRTTEMAVWFMDGSRAIQGQLLNPSQPRGTWKIVAPK